jgi:DNA-binding FadR family transcriptional regulator
MTPIIELKADIEKGLADVAAGRVKDFDLTRIIERGRKLRKEASPAEAFTQADRDKP